MSPYRLLCPLCGSQNLSGRMDAPGASRLLECADCGIVFLEPVPDDLPALYEGYRREGGKRFLYGAEALVRFFRVRRARLIERLSRAPRKTGKNLRILDIGCGRGLMLAELASRGWECYGTELPGQAPGTSGAPFKVYEGRISDLDLPSEFFDVVTLWHVFEHLRDPMRALKEIRRILKPGGLLVISVPNIGSLQAKLFGRRWIHLDLPRHLYHFSPRSLGCALRESGFSIADWSHFSAEHGISGIILSFGALISGRGHDLFSTLRGEGKGFGAAAASMAFAPVAIVFSVLEALLKRGGGMTVLAVKPAGTK